MAAVMYEAARAEDQSLQVSSQRLSQLEYENRYLRELLSLSSVPASHNSATQSALTQPMDGGWTSDCSSDSRSSTPKAITDSPSAK